MTTHRRMILAGMAVLAAGLGFVALDISSAGEDAEHAKAKGTCGKSEAKCAKSAGHATAHHAKAEGRCTQADGKCAKADGKCAKADGKCAKADGKCPMAKAGHGHRRLAAGVTAKALASIQAAQKALDAGKTKLASKHLKEARQMLASLHERMKPAASDVAAKGAEAIEAKAEMPIANKTCPIMGAKISNPEKTPAKLTRTHKGQRVVFCCAGCPAQWDKLSEEKKQALLQEHGQ